MTTHRSLIQSPSLKAARTTLFLVPALTMPATSLKEVEVEVDLTLKETMMIVKTVKSLFLPVSKAS